MKKNTGKVEIMERIINEHVNLRNEKRKEIKELFEKMVKTVKMFCTLHPSHSSIRNS